MIELLSHAMARLADGIARNFAYVVTYPFQPGERLFVLYLASSLAMAAGVYAYVARRRSSSGGTDSLAEFLFPRSIWRTPSAWLDVRYFFFHQVLRVFIYGGFFLVVSDWMFHATAALLGSAPSSLADATRKTAWLVELGYALAAVAALDFVAWVLHYCQHRFPLLWEFHRVHHSARVMHPLTNYREHPVDNIVYAVGLGGCTGLVAAIAAALLGFVPAEPTVLGVGVFVFAFNSLGYHLRHSHVWLRWPGPLVYLFGCPAHHQVHHSYHPSHINKNFAFMFPVWDLAFGTFRLPSTNADVKFGLNEHQEEEFTSCLGLYWVPFRNIASRFQPRREPASTAVDTQP